MADFLPLPEKEYSVIYADPPWEYRQHGTTEKSRGTALKQYPTMTTADICNLPVRKICGGGAACFLWATFPNIAEGIRVLEAWGFSTRLRLCVVKKNAKSGTNFWGMAPIPAPMRRCACWACPQALRPGSGSAATRYTRSLRPRLRGTAKSRTKPAGGSWSCWGMCPAEMFARQRAEGWDAWGNEVPPEERKIE